METAARTIFIKAQNAGVSVPRDPKRKSRYQDGDDVDSTPDEQSILEQAESITDHVSRVVFSAFSLDRGVGCEIHENAYWGL